MRGLDVNEGAHSESKLSDFWVFTGLFQGEANWNEEWPQKFVTQVLSKNILNALTAILTNSTIRHISR